MLATARGNRPGRRDGSRGDRGRGNRGRICRRAADRSPQYAELPAVGIGRQDRSAGVAETWPERDARRVAAGRQYILDGGNPNVMLCERGIRTFEAHTRFTLPLATVPYLHAKTHLPVVVDPSHGTGHSYLVPQMAAAGVAAGADGLIIEVHPDPENVLSDGYQSLTFEQFDKRSRVCRKVAEAVGKHM